MYLELERVSDETPGITSQDEENQFEDALERIHLIEAQGVVRKMKRALEQALNLRGITAELADPLALAGEKSELRESYKRKEDQIRAAITAGEQFLTK